MPSVNIYQCQSVYLQALYFVGHDEVAHGAEYITLPFFETLHPCFKSQVGSTGGDAVLEVCYHGTDALLPTAAASSICIATNHDQPHSQRNS